MVLLPISWVGPKVNGLDLGSRLGPNHSLPPPFFFLVLVKF